MAQQKINQPYRSILLITIVFLLVKNISLTLLVVDISAYIDIFIHCLLIYLIVKNHRYTGTVLWVWATLYLFVYTGIKVGAKSLIILRGDAWEINMPRYYIDLFLVGLGLLLLIFGNKMFEKKT